MKVVHVNELPMEVNDAGVRAGTFKRRWVLLGDEGSRGNFSLAIYYQDGTFFSPRHRHNFDQFRYQIDGQADFKLNGKMTPGILGYFPEGAYYGPQSGPPHTVAVLQFGGPSGLGFLSKQQHSAASAELKVFGEFKDGKFHRRPGAGGPALKDAYEAIWEHVNARPIAYPTPLYDAPILMDTNHVPWGPVREGVSEQHLGSLTHCRIRASRYRLELNARFEARGRGVFMVLSGTGSVAGERIQDLTTVYLDDGESAVFHAETPTLIVLMGMPTVGMMGLSGQPALQAAE